MSTQPRPRGRQATQGVAPNPAGPLPSPGLDWREPHHFDHRGDKPCVLCGHDTPFRSHKREPVHKVCAEDWNRRHPHETRFVTDYQPRRAARADAA